MTFMSANEILFDYLTAVEKFENFTVEKFIKNRGVEYQQREVPRPAGVRKGRDKMCFMNAYRLHARMGFTYVEGFAINVIPIHHAWCVDHEGFVIETTWKNLGDNYYGVPFGDKVIDAVFLETKTYGVIKNCKAFNDYIKRR